MRDYRKYSEEQQARWERRAERYGRHGHIWTGIFILILGIAGLLKVSLLNIPDWVFSWQMLLIVMGFFIGIRRRFEGLGWFVLMVVGGAFLLNDIYPDMSLRRYLWPMILVMVGLLIIARPRRRTWNNLDPEKKNADTIGSDPSSIADNTSVKEDFVDCTSFFGGTKKNIFSKNFKGGDIVNIFGGTELNLTQADIVDGKAIVEITNIFGGTKLVVPSDWAVKSEAVTIFGGIEDKRSLSTAVGMGNKVLIIKGTVLFGGIDIKSF
jgi:predicted membrane protein